MAKEKKNNPPAQTTKPGKPHRAKTPPAVQVRQQGKEHAPETRTTHPHPKDEDRNNAPRQGAPGRKTPKAQRTPRGPQDQDAGSISEPNPNQAHALNPTSSPAQARQQEKKPILRPGRRTPIKRTRTGTAPRAKTTSPPPTPTPQEPTPRSPPLPQPKSASREGDRRSEEILETPKVSFIIVLKYVI